MHDPDTAVGLKQELSRILQAVQLIPPSSFLFDGINFTSHVVMPAGFGPEIQARVAQLQQCLYQNCFCLRFRPGRNATTPALLSQNGDLVPELSRANSTLPRWDNGWQLQKVLATGQIIASKDSLNRMFWPGEFICYDGGGAALRPGLMISVFFPKESSNLQPGFYFAFGENHAGRDDFDLLRLYWNIDAEGAPMLVRHLTHDLNRFEIPFRFKCLTRQEAYERCDAAILYINRRYWRIVTELIANPSDKLETHLRSDTPMFTKRLAPGLALAEDPGNGESFGMHRCRLVAEGIWQAYEQGLEEESERLQFIVEHLTQNGVSLDQPYLSPGSVDQYQLPLP